MSRFEAQMAFGVKHKPLYTELMDAFGRVESFPCIQLCTTTGSNSFSTGPPRKKVKKLLNDSSNSDGDFGNSTDEREDTDVDKYFSSSYNCEDLTSLQFLASPTEPR